MSESKHCYSDSLYIFDRLGKLLVILFGYQTNRTQENTDTDLQHDVKDPDMPRLYIVGSTTLSAATSRTIRGATMRNGASGHGGRETSSQEDSNGASSTEAKCLCR